MLTPEQIDKEVERIKIDYSYMIDEMPLDGWMWEFIRRTKQYKALIEEIQQNEKDGKSNWSLLKNLKHIGVRGSFAIPPPDDDLYQTIVTYPDDNNTSLCIPKNDVKYSAFSVRFPSILGIDPVGYRTFDDLSLYYRYVIEGAIEAAEWKRKKGPFSLKGILEIIPNRLLEDMAPCSLEDTIFIAISTKAQKTDVMEELEDIVDQYVKPPKIKSRKDKWKYYIIVYDLMENVRLENSTIAKIFDKMFPKSGGMKYSKTEIDRWYSQAVLHIDKGRYKDYLLI